VTAAGIVGIDAGTQPNGLGPTWSRGVNEVVMPPPGSPASVARATAWLNATSSSFLYPEQNPQNDHFLPRLLKKPNFGVCMSGGGLRAAILMLGYGRVLWSQGLLQKARYAGSSSGSSWFLAAFSYANATGTPWNAEAVDAAASQGEKNNKNNASSTFDGDAFFGAYLPPERLTEDAARRELGSWGRAVADAQLTPHSLWGGIAYRRRALTWWTDVASDLFLRPFGLHDLSSGTSAWGTQGPVAQRVASVLERASKAQREAEAERAAATLEGNLQAVEVVRESVTKAAGAKAGAAAAAAASEALKTNATAVEERWKLAGDKFGIRRVYPAASPGSPPPVYQACTQDRPYPLLAGTIYAPQDPTFFYPFEMTPMYVGSPGVYENASSPVGPLGGGFVEAHAWNSRLLDGGRRAFADAQRAVAEAEATSAASKRRNGTPSSSTPSIDVTTSVDYFVPLAGQVGVSSAFLAQGFRPSSSPLKQLLAVDHFFYWNQLDFAASKNVLFADGGGTDPLGIYGNLRRGVKALLVLHATFQEPTGAAEEFALAGGYEVASLFGYVPRGATRYSGTSERATAEHSQVFEEREWAPLYQELRARFYAGEPPVIRRKALKVLPNAFQAVRGGYQADVVFVFNVRTAGWEERLPVATRLSLERGRGNGNSPLGSYPVVPTGLAHAGPGLTGLLGQQASWTMIHALPVIKAMLADLPAGERGVGKYETTKEEAARAPEEAAAMAVGLRVGEAPWADVDRADGGLGAMGEKVIDAVVAHVPRGPAPGLVSTAAGKLAHWLGGKSGVEAEEALALAADAEGADAAPSTPSTPSPRGPGAAAVIGNAPVMAALAGAPAESGVGGALAALAAAASPMLVDGRPPTRAESRAAALEGNDPRPAHERWLTRQYTRAQALGSAMGGLRTQAVADTAGKLVSGVEDKLMAPVVAGVKRATDLLAPVKGPLLRRAAGVLAAGDLQGAN
jgi:hypothetical protein